MSKAKSGDKVEDIWVKIDREPKLSEEKSTSTSILFVGDGSSGKSTLIQSFLKPNSKEKDPKPTIAIEYNYARKAVSGSKSVAHIWEAGGDLIEPKLLEVGISAKYLGSTAVFITCDLSKPYNIIESLLRSLKAVGEIVQSRIDELKSTNVNLKNEISDNQKRIFTDHPDKDKVKVMDVPVYILACKYDLFKSTVPTANRRVILQMLRFIAHAHGASLLTTNVMQAENREIFQKVMSSACFMTSFSKNPVCELNPVKTIHITRGSDNFQQILTCELENTNGSEPKLIASMGDIEQYVGAKGLTRDWRKRLGQVLFDIFKQEPTLPPMNKDPTTSNGKKGAAEMESEGKSGEDGGEVANPYPESEIDDVRALRDAALARFIQEAERKEEMQTKMNKSNV